MQTQPAPLDRMTDDSLDDFRVSSPREIGGLLKQLLDGSVLLELHGGGHFVTSALWTMDSSRGTIGFNADPKDPAVQALLDGRKVMVVGYLDSVKLQFDLHGVVLVHGQGASVLNSAFPREMFRFQRRNAFRVRPLLRHSPVMRLRHPDIADLELELRILDLSIGGCSVFLPRDQPSMNSGIVVPSVRLELDADTRIDASVRLKHVTPVHAEAKGVRLGFEFVRAGGDALRTLQRFIDLTQKRAKLMALE